jgi:hypothetical protein
VNPRACLEDLEKRKFLTLPGLELQTLGRPARNGQSLSRLADGLGKLKKKNPPHWDSNPLPRAPKDYKFDVNVAQIYQISTTAVTQ